MDRLRNDYRILHPKKLSKICWIKTHYYQKELLRKSYASVVVIGDSIVAALRRYPTVWRNFILQYKTVNLRIEGDHIENVLWRINDIVLPKSIRSVVIHCGTNNIDTSSSDEISVGVVTIARSIFHRYPKIEIIVNSLLPRDIHWSTRRTKINETNDYLRDYCKKLKKMTFLRQDPGWTLPDNSLNMELHYKDHLHLIENGNMKFSKLITETLQAVISPQSSQSSSYLSKSSLIRSPLPSSLPRSNLLSAQPLSQSSSSQSLSATATPFNTKHQIIFHNSSTAPPKSQTLTASPLFHQDFPSSLKTISDHMSSAKPTKLIISPTSASSLTDTPQLSQMQFQPTSNIPLPPLFTVKSPYTPTFPSSPTPTTHSLYSAIPSTSCHHLVPHPRSKVLPTTPDSSLHVAQHVLKKCKYHLPYPT